jgi:osmotically-inducible protein OsmY
MIAISKSWPAMIASLSMLAGCSMSPQKSVQQTAADAATGERIYAALNADPTYYFRHVDVRVDNGVAQLSGYIWSTPALYRAEQIVRRVPGVRTVVNQMELEREGNRGGGHPGTG